MDFRTFLKTRTAEGRPIFSDGGMGTMIQASGVTGYKIPEELNFTHPDVIRDIHCKYLAAGSDLITTNTFGGTPIKMHGAPYSSGDTIRQAVSLVKQAIERHKAEHPESGPKYTMLDLGPSGKLIEPAGSMTFDEAYTSYAQAAVAGEKAGADLAIIETMSDLYEVKAAVLAVKENTNLPIIASITFQDNLRTLSGADVSTVVTYMEALGVDVVGLNCGVSLDDAAKLTAQFTAEASIPVMIQPNAGLPQLENGKTVFKVLPEEFGEAQLKNRLAGASILGGCCGTTPAHIEATVSRTANIASEPRQEAGTRGFTSICSGSTTVRIGGEYGAMIVGERINPTGKKKCKEALLSGDSQFILDEAEKQLAAGAHILDVNVGLPGIDEQKVMAETVFLLQKTFTCPLQIDSSESNVLAEAMRRYNGKPLVNSVNGKRKVMDAVFPLVKKYGGSVVALCLNEEGIPPTAEGRLEIAANIVQEAAKYGIQRKDIFIDMLTLTVSSQQKEASETIRGIQLLKTHPSTKGVKTVLGVSNISFGLPRRDIINGYFFGMALSAGLDACIINPLSQPMLDAYRSYRAIYAFDENCMDYIDTYAGTTAPTAASIMQAATPASQATSKPAAHEGTVQSGQAPSAPTAALATADGGTGSSPLFTAIVKGYPEKAETAAKELLETLAPMDIVNQYIVPALDNVGDDYAAGRKFLPQLLLSAETVSKVFAVIKTKIASDGQPKQNNGRIIMATVQGDIHDIGKNIVSAMLENYGFEVIDLGKDVAPETIIQTALEKDVRLIGLSALMTTTVLSMENTIRMLRETETQQKAQGKDVKFTIMVGGAVLTPEYAEKIGADYYGKDAMATVAIAKKVLLGKAGE